MAVSPSVLVEVNGARGESVADVARRTGAWGTEPTDTDEEVLEDRLGGYLVENAESVGLFPDTWFATSSAASKMLIVSGKDYLTTAQNNAVWVPDFQNPFGKGAWKVTGNTNVKAFRVWYNSPAAVASGVVEGESIKAIAFVVAPASLNTSIALRFIDSAGAYVGVQAGTSTVAGIDGVQARSTSAVTIPSGAAGHEVFLYSSVTDFYVCDVDSCLAANAEALLAKKAADAPLVRAALAEAALDTKIGSNFIRRDVVAPTTDVAAVTATISDPRIESDGYSGWGQTYDKPASNKQYNSVFIRSWPRPAGLTPSKRAVRLKATLRSDATSPFSSTATVVATGEIYVNPDTDTLGPLNIPLRNLTGITSGLITTRNTDDLPAAKYGIIVEGFTDTGKAVIGNAQGAANPTDGTRLFSYYVTTADGQTGTWATFAGGTPVVSMGLSLVSGATVTQSSDPSADFSAKVLANVTVPPLPPAIYTGRARQLRALTGQIKGFLGTGRVILGLIGDSWSTSVSYYSRNLAKLMIADIGDGGVGYASFGYPSGTAISNNNSVPDARGLYYMIYGVGTSGWTTNYHAGSTCPSHSDIRSSTAGDYVRLRNVGGATHPALSAVMLHYTGTADGVIKWSYNNGSSWSVDTNVQGTVGQQYALNMTGFPTGALSGAAANTIDILVQVVSGSVTLGGIDLQSATNGIVIHKLGASGAKISDLLTSNATEWQRGIGLLSLTSAYVLSGTNEAAAQQSATTYSTNMGTMADRVHAAGAGIDVMLSTPPVNLGTYGTLISGYAAAMPAIAQSKKTAYLNLQSAFGEPDNAAQYGVSGAVPMLDVSNEHPGTMGSAAIARAMHLAWLYQ